MAISIHKIDETLEDYNYIASIFKQINGKYSIKISKNRDNIC